MTLNSKEHMLSLDGLRGIAILMVFLHHYFPRNLHNPISIVASLGWSGVDLFFVLSGFLITGILFDTRPALNRFSSFYARRALRLLPVYCLAVAVVLIGTKFLRGYRMWTDIPLFIYGANIVRLIPGGIFVFPPYFDCGHFWSLALEEQFYSIWPFVVFLIPSRRTLLYICAGGIAFALMFRIAILLTHLSVWWSYTQLPARMDSLLVGSALALGLRGLRHDYWLNPRRLWRIFVACCLLLAGVLAAARTLFFTSQPMTTVGYTVLAVLYACILALALIPGTMFNRIGSNAILRFFGRYSYGLYVWHYLVNPICTRWSGVFRSVIHPDFLADMVYALSMLALFTTCAVLSYWLVEIHFLKLKSKFKPFLTGPVTAVALRLPS